MPIRRRHLVVALPATPALAQARPLRVLVGFPPGASLDLLARLLAEPLGLLLGRPVVVENRAGGGGRVAAEFLARAVGNTDVLMAAPLVVPVFFPSLYRNLPFDPLSDLAPVARLSSFSFALTVRGQHPAHDLAGFLDWARPRGEAGTYGSLSAGTPSHFLGLLFNQATGTTMRHIPYGGGAPLVTAILAGEVDAGFPVIGGIGGQLSSGALRALAVSGATRSPLAPAVPSFAELGGRLAAMGQAGLWYGMFAPRDVAVAPVAQALRAVLVDRVLAGRLAALDMPPWFAGPEDFSAAIQADRARWAPVIAASGFTLED